MRRGDIVTVALSGEFGKPRPAVIVETDRLAPTDHVVLCPGTSHIRPDVEQRRVHVEPNAENGLRSPTQFQIDKITVVRRSKCGPVVGHLDATSRDRLNGVLFLIVGLAD